MTRTCRKGSPAGLTGVKERIGSVLARAPCGRLHLGELGRARGNLARLKLVAYRI